MSVTFRNELLLPEHRTELLRFLRCEDQQAKIFVKDTAYSRLLRAAEKVRDTALYLPSLGALVVASSAYGITQLFHRYIHKVSSASLVRSQELMLYFNARALDFPIKAVLSDYIVPISRTHNGISPFSSLQMNSIPKEYFYRDRSIFGLYIHRLAQFLKIPHKLHFCGDSFTFFKKNFSLKKTITSGICYGVSTLFAFLVLQGLQRGSMKEAQLLKIAAAFKNGAPEAAVFLQAIDRPYDLMNLKKQERFTAKEGFIEQDLKVNFQKMPVGVYTVELPYHVMNLIKLDSGRLYLFDSNTGLHRLNAQHPEKHCRRLMGYLLHNWERANKALFVKHPSLFDKYKNCLVKFTRFSL